MNLPSIYWNEILNIQIGSNNHDLIDLALKDFEPDKPLEFFIIKNCTALSQILNLKSTQDDINSFKKLERESILEGDEFIINFDNVFSSEDQDISKSLIRYMLNSIDSEIGVSRLNFNSFTREFLRKDFFILFTLENANKFTEITSQFKKSISNAVKYSPNERYFCRIIFLYALQI